MITPPIFPPSEDDGFEPYRAIGRRLGCDEYEVSRAFYGLGIPEWESPAHLNSVKKTTHSLNEAARFADNLVRSMMRLSQQERETLVVSGAPTSHQIEFLRDTLAGDAADLKSWGSKRDRTGGRNPAAHTIAEGMRRFFRRRRKPITFGNRADGGPSTDFGREVEFAIGAFGIRADWRRPAEEAAKKQDGIKSRMVECGIRKFREDQLKNPPIRPDMTGIKIEVEVVGKRRFYVISLNDFPEIPSFKIDSKTVADGNQVANMALQWAVSVRAAKG